MIEPTPAPRKKVDSDWLERVEAEKLTGGTTDKASSETSASRGTAGKPGDKTTARGPEVNFSLFLSTLALQAYVGLGEMEDPATRSKKVNLDQARYMIEILEVVQNKTKGNLSPEEDKTLNHILYDLRLKYVEKAGVS